MKNFFKKRQEIALIGITLIFVALLAAFFVFGVRTIVVSVNDAINSKSAAGASATFDLQGAENLDLKGLVK